MCGREDPDDVCSVAMQERKFVKGEVDEAWNGEDGEGRSLEGEEDAEREEGIRHHARAAAGGPPGFGYGVLGREAEEVKGVPSPAEVEYGGGRGNVIRTDAAEDGDDGYEEGQRDDLGIGSIRETYTAPPVLSGSRLPSPPTDRPLCPVGAEDAGAEAGGVHEGKDEEDQGEGEPEQV
jgi:hypothetical protein